ncbi:MAG TPA: hypothetical protein ENK02_01200 [Planctomycetes bacterium]|nr:hypothetical protein [Planctomycetota bacterium]
MADPNKANKKKISGNPLLVLVLVAGAVYVNWDVIKGLFRWETQKTTRVQVKGPEAEQPMGEPSRPHADPAPGAVAAFLPVRMDEEIPNPFGAVEEKAPGEGKAPAGKEPGSPENAGKNPVEIPKEFRLRLVLLTGKSRSALIGGRMVGVGDQLPLGTVEVIARDHVELKGEGGRRILLPLRKAPLLVHRRKGKAPAPAEPAPHSPSPPKGKEAASRPVAPSGPQVPMDPKDLLKVLRGFTPSTSQGKE